MMAAMMLPSVAPMVTLFARTAEAREPRARSAALTFVFVAGYFAAWTAYGLAAYGLYRLVDELDGGVLAWDDAGPYVAGGAIVAAGVYQLTPLKRVCLRHCRGPLHFLFARWRPGFRGAARLGDDARRLLRRLLLGPDARALRRGRDERLLDGGDRGGDLRREGPPWGERLSIVFAVAFVVFGLWIALAPDSVPGLTDPAQAPMMQSDGAVP